MKFESGLTYRSRYFDSQANLICCQYGVFGIKYSYGYLRRWSYQKCCPKEFALRKHLKNNTKFQIKKCRLEGFRIRHFRVPKKIRRGFVIIFGQFASGNNILVFTVKPFRSNLINFVNGLAILFQSYFLRLIIEQWHNFTFLSLVFNMDRFCK